jgi:hypothetical protein
MDDFMQGMMNTGESDVKIRKRSSGSAVDRLDFAGSFGYYERAERGL